MTRYDAIQTVDRIIMSDRNLKNGEPEDSFGCIATYWTEYLKKRFKNETFFLEDFDVAALMALLKIARIAQNPLIEDSWVDVAGYSCCGVELATTKEITIEDAKLRI